MKKYLIAFACVLMAFATASAQILTKNYPPETLTITVKAKNDEVFTVKLDGKSYGKAPGKEFTIKDLQPKKMYDLEVKVQEPVKDVIGTDLELGAGHYVLIVSSDVDAGTADIAFGDDADIPKDEASQGGANSSKGNADKLCNDSDVSQIISLMEQDPFDDTRMHYAKGFVKKNRLLSTEQIRRIAAAFSYDNARLPFVKYAYDYCADKENYGSLAETLDGDEAKSAFAEYLRGK